MVDEHAQAIGEEILNHLCYSNNLITLSLLLDAKFQVQDFLLPSTQRRRNPVISCDLFVIYGQPLFPGGMKLLDRYGQRGK